MPPISQVPLTMDEARILEVVVIDDDEAVLDSFRFMLRAAGVEIAAYLSAIDYLERAGAPPRCLILDQNMPRMTGLELADRLRATGIGAPILLITSSVSASIIDKAAALGIAGVIQKPPAEDTILRFVGAGLDVTPPARA